MKSNVYIRNVRNGKAIVNSSIRNKRMHSLISEGNFFQDRLLIEICQRWYRVLFNLFVD